VRTQSTSWWPKALGRCIDLGAGCHRGSCKSSGCRSCVQYRVQTSVPGRPGIGILSCFGRGAAASSPLSRAAHANKNSQRRHILTLSVSSHSATQGSLWAARIGRPSDKPVAPPVSARFSGVSRRCERVLGKLGTKPTRYLD
jgi:hypothetical protein